MTLSIYSRKFQKRRMTEPELIDKDNILIQINLDFCSALIKMIFSLLAELDISLNISKSHAIIKKKYFQSRPLISLINHVVKELSAIYV